MAYQDIPPEERKRAEELFAQGRKVAAAGQYPYAITCFLSGLKIDPENVEGHQVLREYALKHKAGGGKSEIGFMEAMKLRRVSKDDRDTLQNAERLLCYDPGNTDPMLMILQAAWRAGFYDTVMWIGPILLKANEDMGKKADASKYVALKDIYRAMAESNDVPKGLRQELYRRAAVACQRAADRRPDDMELVDEVRRLGALEAMEKGGYTTATSFRDSVKDPEGQKRLMEDDKDVRTLDALTRAIAEAEAEWKADASEIGKFSRYIDLLEKTESLEYENSALELLEDMYKKTQQFRFRQRIGKIKMTQLRRMERGMRQQVDEEPQNADLQKSLHEFAKEKIEFELSEYQLWAENYPTDMSLRAEVGKRLFILKRFDEAIPILQQARQDPKVKFDAALLLGRAFLEAGFADEAVDTLQGAISEYQLRGSDLAKELNYWLGRALELKGDNDAATKRYSQVAQWDWNYRDVQARIRRLRTGSA